MYSQSAESLGIETAFTLDREYSCDRPPPGINKPHIVDTLSSPPPRPLFSSPLIHLFANTMMFMRTIFTISLAAFALAVPVDQPRDDPSRLESGLSAFGLSQDASFTSLIILT